MRKYLYWFFLKTPVFINIFKHPAPFHGPPYQGRTGTKPKNLNRISISFLIFMLSPLTFAGPGTACKNLFTSSKPLEYKLSSNTQLKQTYSKELFDKLYQQIANSSLLSQKEKQKFILETEKSIHFIEHHSQNQKLQILSPKLISAVQSLPSILRWLEEGSPPTYLDTTTGLKVVLSALTQYSRAYLTQESNHLDWPRLQAILSAISHFKEEPNAFSFYKILRTVREKHSFNEFINCR